MSKLKQLAHSDLICISVNVCVRFLGETLVNVLDFKKDMGLWHGVLTVSLLLFAHCVKCWQCSVDALKAVPNLKPVVCFSRV